MERDKKGRFIQRDIDLRPTYNLGYFCGLVLGDGFFNNKYQIRIESPKEILINVFAETLNELGLKVWRYKKVGKNCFKPNTLFYGATVCSKKLYYALRPYKLKDYKWSIPKFLTTKESQLGFIGGIFDAEGSLHKKGFNATIVSKHKENLLELKKLMDKEFKYGKITVKEYDDKLHNRKTAVLYISGILNLQKLVQLTKIKKKDYKYKVFHTPESYYRVVDLWKEKIPIKEIVERTKVPLGTICNWLYNKKKYRPYYLNFYQRNIV